MAVLSGDLGRTTPGTTHASSAGATRRHPSYRKRTHPGAKASPESLTQPSTEAQQRRPAVHPGPRCRLDLAQTPQQGWPKASAPGVPRTLSTLTLGPAPRWLWALVSAGSSHLPQQALLPRGVHPPSLLSCVPCWLCSRTPLGLLDLELTPRPSCESPDLHPGLPDTPPPGPPEQGRSGSSLPAPMALSFCC